MLSCLCSLPTREAESIKRRRFLVLQRFLFPSFNPLHPTLNHSYPKSRLSITLSQVRLSHSVSIILQHRSSSDQYLTSSLYHLTTIIMSCYYPNPSAPLSVPQKQGAQAYPYPYQSAYSRVSASPPEHAESSTGSGVPSYGSSSLAGSSYAGSEYDSSSSGANSIDLLDYMNDRLSSAYNPLPLDKSLATQTQT